MKLQGNGAERFAKKPDPNCQFALIFGADEGVVADAANQLIRTWENQLPTTLLTADKA